MAPSLPFLQYSQLGELLASFGPANGTYTGMTVSPDGALLYACTASETDPDNNRVETYDAASGALLRAWALPSVAVGGAAVVPRPQSLAPSPDGTVLYVAAGGVADLLLLDASSGALMDRWPLGADVASVEAVAADPDSGRVFTAATRSSAPFVFQPIVAAWAPPAAAGTPPSALWQAAADALAPVTQLAVDGATGTLLVAGSRTPAALSATTGAVLATFGDNCAPSFVSAPAPCRVVRAIGAAEDAESRLVFFADEATRRLELYTSRWVPLLRAGGEGMVHVGDGRPLCLPMCPVASSPAPPRRPAACRDPIEAAGWGNAEFMVRRHAGVALHRGTLGPMSSGIP